jgi:hypothetical protein
MSRIDRYLDGDLDRSALTEEERALADRLEASIEEARSYVAARPTPDLAGRVLTRIGGTRPSAGWGWHATVRWLREALWTTRRVSFRLRPVYVLLAVAFVAPLTVRWATDWLDGVPLQIDAPGAAAPEVLVRFRLEVPDAQSVQLAGSFTNWEARFELHEVAPGVWTGVLPVPIGVHEYAFLIDGTRWLADPYAPQVSDGFGGMNSRLALLLAGPKT